MPPPPPRSTRTHTVVPSPPLFRPLQSVGGLPAATADILGEAHAGELLQPPGPERLLERGAIGRCNQAIGIHRPSQAPVDCRQPFLTDIVSQPRLDFLVGARPKIERHQFGRPLRSEEHTSDLQSLMRISYAVSCLKNNT